MRAHGFSQHWYSHTNSRAEYISRNHHALIHSPGSTFTAKNLTSPMNHGTKLPLGGAGAHAGIRESSNRIIRCHTIFAADGKAAGWLRLLRIFAHGVVA